MSENFVSELSIFCIVMIQTISEREVLQNYQ